MRQFRRRKEALAAARS